MSSINDGGPAFPNLGYNKEANYNGMTLRDYFAGQALAQIGNNYTSQGPVTIHAKDHALELASHAYNIADAMIAAREVKP